MGRPSQSQSDKGGCAGRETRAGTHEREQAHAHLFMQPPAHTQGRPKRKSRGDPVSPLTGWPAAARPHLLIGGCPGEAPVINRVSCSNILLRPLVGF